MLDLLPIPAVAELVGLHRSVVFRAMQRGQLKATRVGWAWLVERTEAERYAASERKSGPRPKIAPSSS